MIRLLLAFCLFAAPALADTTIAPTQRTSVSVSGTIATGGTFQQALPADGSRTGCAIQNQSTHTMLFYLGTTAAANAAAAGIQVAPGAIFNCSAWGPVALTDAVQVETSTTADAFFGFYQH